MKKSLDFTQMQPFTVQSLDVNCQTPNGEKSWCLLAKESSCKARNLWLNLYQQDPKVKHRFIYIYIYIWIHYETQFDPFMFHGLKFQRDLEIMSFSFLCVSCKSIICSDFFPSDYALYVLSGTSGWGINSLKGFTILSCAVFSVLVSASTSRKEFFTLWTWYLFSYSLHFAC